MHISVKSVESRCAVIPRFGVIEKFGHFVVSMSIVVCQLCDPELTDFLFCSKTSLDKFFLHLNVTMQFKLMMKLVLAYGQVCDFFTL